ncbi:MAG: DUF6378 domain-containing protein [Halobacteriota archaeon]
MENKHDDVKPMKFLVDGAEQRDEVIRVLEGMGYSPNYTPKFPADHHPCVYAWADNFGGLTYECAYVEKYKTASSVEFVVMDAEEFVREHTKPIWVPLTEPTPPLNAVDVLNEASSALTERAKERDHTESGERSMQRCVESFNAMRGHKLSVEDGWVFMVFLKMARSVNGDFLKDDYVDMAAYCALAGEEAAK